MFEIIGLLFAVAYLFALAALASVACAAIARLVLIGRPVKRLRFVWMSAALPFLCASYILLSTIVLEFAFGSRHDLFFGDIREPLPNGYVLAGLGKMHNFVDIIHPFNSDGEGGTFGVHGIESLAISGTTLYGQFSHEFDNPTPNGDYFAFDTRTNSISTFRSKSELDRIAKYTVTLVDPSDFRSLDPSHRRLVNAENWARFLPPAIALLFWLVWLFYQRQRTLVQTATI